MTKNILPFGLALAALNQANASVVYTKFGEEGFTSSLEFFSGVSFNPQTGDVGEFNEVNPAFDVGGCFGAMFINTLATFNTIYARVDVVTNPDNAARFLTSGTSIDSNSASWFTSSGFVSVEGGISGQPGSYAFDNTPFYFGFRFQLDEMDEEDFYYGYAQVSGFYDGQDMSFTVYDTAYNSTINEGISVGAIPEPSAVILMTFAFGAGLMRRRRPRSA